MKIHFCGVTAFLAVLSAKPAHAQAVFADVPANHWAAAAVKRLAEAGIIEGFPAGAATRDATANTAAAPRLKPVIQAQRPKSVMRRR